MAEDLSNIWDPIEYAKEPRAQKLTYSKDTILNPQQLNCTKDKVYNDQIKNLKYLNQHPEIRALIRLLFKEIVEEKPTNIENFFRDFFKRPVDVLEYMIAEHVKDFPMMNPRSNSRQESSRELDNQRSVKSRRTDANSHKFKILFDSSPLKFDSSETLIRNEMKGRHFLE